MKIAYLVNQYPAISHTFVRREIRALEDLGVEVERFSMRRVKDALQDPADRAEAERTRVILDRGVRGLASGLVRSALKRPRALARAARRAVELGMRSDRGMLYQGAYLAEACVLVDWLEQAGVEHVHAHFGTNSASVAMLARELGGPEFSFTTHGPEEFDKPEAIKLGAKVEAARFVAAISSFGRSQIWRRVAAKDWSKVHIVRCGLDAAFLEREPTPVPDVPRVCCVGRLNEQKGHTLLIEAVAKLVREGVDVQLVLVGDGELRGAIEKRIAELGIQANVTITGWASGDVVRREILASRAMVLPSFAEGLPVVIMEALALGRPVISTYVAGIPELIEPGVCGWLAPAGSVDATAEAIRECLATDVKTLTRMGAEGRRRVLAMHDVRESARRLKALLEGRAPEESPASTTAERVLAESA